MQSVYAQLLLYLRARNNIVEEKEEKGKKESFDRAR